MKSSLAVLAIAISGAACADRAETQTLTGRVEPGFPIDVRAVKVTTSDVVSWNGDAVVGTAPVAADGTFSVDVLSLPNLQLELIGDGHSTVIFPRSAGGIASVFAILDHGDSFDLGGIRYVGDPASTTFVFSQIGGGSGSGGMQCDSDGHDANGAMCIDDSDEDDRSCRRHHRHHGHHEDGDDHDGKHHEGDRQHADPGDGPDMGDAVPEHNWPASGCRGHHHKHEHDDDDEHDND